MIDRLRTFWANLHALPKFLAVLVFLGLLALIAFGPARSTIGDWRTDRMVGEAKTALDKRQFAAARDLAIQVIRRRPGDTEILPTLLASCVELSDPRSTQVALMLLSGGDFSPAQRAAAWQSLCQSGPAYLQRGAWQLISPDERADPAFLLPMIERLLHDREPHSALALIPDSSGSLSENMERARLKALAAIGDSTSLYLFQKNLLRIIGSRPAEWADWLGFLDQLPQDTLLIDTANAILNHAATTIDPATRLRLASCELVIHPEARAAIIRRNIGEFAAGSPLILARWLIKIGDNQAASELIDQETPSPDPETVVPRIELLTALNRPDEIDQLLAGSPPGMPAWETAVRRAAIASARSDEKTASAFSQDALKAAAATPDPAASIQLARMAEDLDLGALAIDAWIQAITSGAGPLPQAESLGHVIERLAKDRREQELIAVLNALRYLEPGNPVILVQSDYLSLLNGSIDPETVVSDLTPIHEAFPDQMPIACVLALAHLLAGDAQAAAAMTDGPDIDWFSLSSSYRAIRSLTLKAVGRQAEAAIVWDDLDWEAMLPLERRVMASLADQASKP